METVSMDRWKDKVAVVTGASSGIGYAVARRLANNGMIVAGCALATDMDKMQARFPELELHANYLTFAVTILACNRSLLSCIQGLQKECPVGKFYPFQADLRNEHEIKAFFKFIDDKLGRVDVLINNAGIGRMTTMIDPSSEGMKSMFALNVLAPCFCTREALAIMEKADVKHGYIMFTNSVSGHTITQQKPGEKLRSMYGYEATKHALKVLVEGLRQELRAKGSRIRVGEVSPGAVETDIEKSWAARDKDDSYNKDKADVERENRRNEYCMMTPDDMADAFTFMLQMPDRCDINEIIIQHMPKAAM